MSIRSGWFIVFLVFYFLVELLSRCSIFEKGILASPAIIVELFISPFLSVFASCILVVCHQMHQFSSVQFSHSVVSDSVTPWIAARQASLSIRYIYGYNFYIFLMDWPFNFYIFLMDWPFCHCEIFFFISGNIFLYVLKSILSDISQYSHSTFVVVAVCMIYLLSVYSYLSKQSVSLIEKIQVDLFFLIHSDNLCLYLDCLLFYWYNWVYTCYFAFNFLCILGLFSLFLFHFFILH